MGTNFRKISVLLPLLLMVGGILAGSCSRIRKVRPTQTYSVAVIHSWDSIGEEAEYFSTEMQKAFEEEGVNVELHHIYANMVHRTGTVFSKYDWPQHLDSLRAWSPDIILLNDDPIVDWVLTQEKADSILIKTPIVFAGVNMLLRDSLEKYPLMTGFEARIDLVRNIELLTKMDN